MGRSIVREAAGLAPYLLEESLFSSESIKLHSVRKEDEFAEIDVPYPYEGQEKIVGEIEYQFEGRKGYSPTRDLEFEYRAGSGLFTLSSKSTPPELEQVVSKMNNCLANENRITRIRSADRQSVMELFQDAHQIKSATFSSRTSNSTVSEISVQGKAVEESVQLVDANSGDVHQSIDLANNPVRRVEGIYRHGEEYVTIIYEKGKISISHPKLEFGQFDFALQLIESYLI